MSVPGAVVINFATRHRRRTRATSESVELAKVKKDAMLLALQRPVAFEMLAELTRELADEARQERTADGPTT